jgi:D-psicose/D-tagatose/L-ribulose 3-epimerase
MKLSVSNLAWAPEVEKDAFRLLQNLDAAGIEVAPTRIADWDALTPARLGAYRQACNDHGLQISSLQAIFFNKPQAQLLGTELEFAAMLEHMRLITSIADALGAGVAVLGAPRNRNKHDRPDSEADELAIERFYALGSVAAEGGLVIGIEPVPEGYGSDFLTRASSMLKIVRACGHPRVAPHIDVACVEMAGDNIADAIDSAGTDLAHYHATEVQLGPFDAPQSHHADAAAALQRNHYRGWVAIEMRQHDGNGLAAVEQAVSFVKQKYAGVSH